MDTWESEGKTKSSLKVTLDSFEFLDDWGKSDNTTPEVTDNSISERLFDDSGEEEFPF